jgi:DNA polymerase-4
MDAFFASVEQLTRPTLRGRAVLVGGLGPRGTVAGASYESREYGARSAMPMAEARRRCPVAVVLPPRFRVYQEVSARVFAIVRGLSADVEQVSIDEAFLEPAELTGAEPAAVEEFAASLRERIAAEVGVRASVGAGSGKQLAKISSGLAKPDGAMVVPPDEEAELLAELPVRKLWGIGPVTEGKLRRIGVQRIGELAAMQPGDVVSLLGQAHGTELHRLARGVDDHPVAERAESKQVGTETTFDTDITGQHELLSELRAVAESAHRRLLSSGRAARTVTVKVRDSAFTTISRSETFASATSDLGSLAAAARRLAVAAVPAGTPVRLVGVSYSGLTAAEQEPLFDNPADQPDSPAQQRTSEEQPAPSPSEVSGRSAGWKAGDDVHHGEHGHGWVQGAGHGRVTARFETAGTGPGRARTFAADDPDLKPADPLASLR